MTIVYVAADNDQGNELWISDDNFENRRLLKDISVGLVSSDPTNLTSLPDGRVLFVATDQVHGRELWVTDGTEAGTRILRDIGTGDGTYGPEQLTALADGRVIFTADDGVHGRELWLTDGTTQGTKLLSDITAGDAGSSFGEFRDLGNGRLLFSANDGTGMQQWATDGTAEGTVKLGLLFTNTPTDYVMDYVVRYDGEGHAFFEGTPVYENGQLISRDGWSTDGTIEGTVKVPSTFGLTGAFYNIGGEDDHWIFKNFEGSGGSGGRPLLYLSVFDGETQSHVLPGPIGGTGETSSMGALDGERVVFTAGARNLWVSDGTTDGTYEIAKNVADGSSVQFLSLGNGKALFSTVYYDSADLWMTDGTTEGTVQLAPLASWTPHGLPTELTLLEEGSALFAAPTSDGNPEAVWRVNFWEGGLERIEDVQHWTGTQTFEAAKLGDDIWGGNG
jgi:ELWxxDGT repeat protein